MPYKSAAQRKFMHARHPEIAAQWDEEIRSAKKKGKYRKPPERVTKSASTNWLKPLAIGTTGGALANQLPSFEEQRRLRENRRRRKARKGKVRKMLAPTSPDPDFDQEAAQKAFDLVMKMDDDTAQMFCHVVVSDYFEEIIEKNLDTLQRHLNTVIAKQLDQVKAAHLRLVSKGMNPEDSVAYAQALALIEKGLEPVSKVGAAQRYGYQWREEDFRRDPGTGQFRAKISHNQTKLLRGKTGQAILGVETPKEHHGVKLSEQDRIRFQDEYRQLAQFLDTVNESTGGRGNQSVLLHYRDRNGKDFTQLHVGSKPPRDDLLDPSYRLVGVDAKPTTLTAGGAAFGLATALGGTMNREQVRAFNQIEGGEGAKFAEAWLKPGDNRNSNERLYNRLAASGSLLSAVGGPKTMMAGKLAQIVGSAGPEAEAVIGPTMRRTAYRYRGTEKTPDRNLVRAYDDGVRQGKKYGLEAEPEEEIRRGPGRGTSHGSMRAAGSRTTGTRRSPQVGEPTPLHRMAVRGASLEERAPTWEERDLGRQVVVQALRNKMPTKRLYQLQLASGNTPPSEGVILNEEGQIAVQAVGYGDDHYLPFNLKNLKPLKNGEFIRTRSVGGLTSEDIYTGLVSGARQVTVTSRSGTYTMTFKPDFRGGRRHNDKARRMTRRYEQLLDAVQSQQVERGEIDPEMRQAIEAEVKEEMSGPGWTHRDRQDAIRERIEEFKENPYISEQDEARAEVIINARAAGADTKERAQIRAEVYDDLMDQKETRFRLNSEGYRAALDALAEQFPYYITTKFTPARDAEKKISPEKDLGYVEPGRNRPTAARAGLHGTSANPGAKFSASQADYQGGRSSARRAQASQPEAGSSAGTATQAPAQATQAPAAVHAARAEIAATQEAAYKASEVAQKIQASAKATLNEADYKSMGEAGSYTTDQLRSPNPLQQEKVKQFVSTYLNDKNVRASVGETAADAMLREWEQAIGFRERKSWSKETATTWPSQPAKFEGPSYQPGAGETKVLKELDRVDKASRAGLINAIPHSHMTDEELQNEHKTLTQLQELLAYSPDLPLNARDLESRGVDLDSPGLGGGLRTNPEVITSRLENIQRIRTLLSNLSPEARKARAAGSPAETKVVVHPTLGTSPSALAKREAEQMQIDLEWLRKQPDPDKVELEVIRDLHNALVDAAPRSTQELELFRSEHQREYQVVDRARKRLKGQ